MTAKFALRDSNVVVLAQNYNPSIVSKEWLFDKKIITGKIVNFVHTPILSIVETEQCAFVLDENRLQISVKNTEAPLDLPKIVSDFISLLPETPYKALGFNFVYRMPTENSNLSALLEPKDTKLKAIFADDYKMGMLASFLFEGFLVLVNIPPMQENVKQIAVSINFHSDNCDIEKVKNKLSLYSKAASKADAILKGLTK